MAHVLPKPSAAPDPLGEVDSALPAGSAALHPSFTPGPWQWFPSVSKERSAVIDTALSVDSTNGTIIAEVTRGKQFHANAHLIAAAPELYETLAEVCAWLEDNWCGGELRERSRTALAKARGQA